MKAIFSGRFDPPHPGHIAQIIRQAREYEHVNVVVLDYPTRSFPVGYVCEIFSEILSDRNVSVYSNKTHFGEINIEEIKEIGGDIWLGGNLKVLRHMERIGFPSQYIPRVFEYEASKYERL